MRTLLTAAAALLITIGTANANIIFTPGNHPQPDEENVLFSDSEVGLTLANGEVDHTGTTVRFTTLGGPSGLQLLQQQAQGQADILCFANCINNGAPNVDNQLSSIRMSAGLDINNNLTAWGDAIINLDFGVGTALITVTDNFGAPFEFVLGNGQNFLTMVAVDGQLITRIDVTNANPGEDFGFNSFKQPRVSGVQSLTPVDEPGSLALLGAGLIGTGLMIRRRQKKGLLPGHGYSAA